MDPLSDLLRVVRLDGAFFFTVEAAEPWTVETAAAKELSPRIMPDAEHLISYHVLTEGRCFGGLVGEEQVELVPDDVIVFPHGDANVARPSPDSPATVRGSKTSGRSVIVGFICAWHNWRHLAMSFRQCLVNLTFLSSADGYRPSRTTHLLREVHNEQTC